MSGKTYLDKAAILAQDDLAYEDIQIPEWGGAWVRVRTLNASERDRFEASTVVRNGKKTTVNLENIRARLCLLCLVGGKSAAALDRIFTVAQRLNGLTDADVQDLEKNLPAVQNGDSVSD
jgi:hypothetical protein